VRRVRRAIHIGCGGARGAQALDAWLDRHGIERTCCADAFDACAHILTSSACVPELAFVAADRLTNEELVILGYLRETWPAVGIVLYGRDAESDSRTRDARTLVCPSAVALREVLAASPAHLLARFQQCSSAIGRGGELNGLFTGRGKSAATLPEPKNDSGRPGAGGQTADSGTLTVAQPSSARGPYPPSPDAPRNALTREELSVLLEDTHD
jgi:hypothetical protein